MSQSSESASSGHTLSIAEQRQPQVPELNKAALTMLLAALVTAAAPFWYLIRTPRLEGVLATALLVLPSILIVFGAVRLLTIKQTPELLTLGTSAFDVLKNLLVAAYCWTEATSAPAAVLAWLALGIACLLVVLVYRLTSWIMNAHVLDGSSARVPLTPWREGVIQQLLLHRFLSICGLLVAYLHLVLLLSLAIAFHDRATVGDSIERQVRRSDLPTTARKTQPLESPKPQAPDDNIRSFAFPLGSTSLACTMAVNAQKFNAKFFQEKTPNRWRVDQLRESELLEECASELRETAWNVSELHWLKTEVSNAYTRAPFDRYRIAVVAHASDNKPHSGFSSNYEMSRARAEQVQALVETMLSKLREGTGRPPLNVEWQIMPSGTGNMYLAPARSPDVDRLKEAGLSRALTTEVQFTRIPDHLTQLQRESLDRRNGEGSTPELQLLDYLYFMTTAAAANDLAPASSFVQFVASAGHISQLFLLVVAFNVILAFRRPLISPAGAPTDGLKG